MRAMTCQLYSYVRSKLTSVLARQRVRGVHVGHMETTLQETKLFRFRERGDPITLADPKWSPCVPLVWWPLWDCTRLGS